MATTYKVLGESAPSATTLTTLYEVPAATSTVVSTITVTNLGGSAASYRIAVRKAGASIEQKQYIAYDTPIDALDTVALTMGVTLAATDIISVYASTANFSFHAFGSEITA